MKKADSWADVVEMIREAQGASEEEAEEETEEEEEEAEEITPNKGDVYNYKPPKSKKTVEVEVIKVLSKAKTCDVKNLDDGKSIYKAVPWSQLSE